MRSTEGKKLRTYHIGGRVSQDNRYDRAITAAVKQVVISISSQVDLTATQPGALIMVTKPLDNEKIELSPGFYGRVMGQLNERWKGKLRVTSISQVTDNVLSLTTSLSR